jgi:hypothetical protein
MLPLVRIPLLPGAVRLALRLALRLVQVLRTPAWEVSLALQETSVVMPKRVQVDLRVLQAARAFLISVHQLEVQLVATLMLRPRQRLLLRPSVNSALDLKARATLALDLVAKSLELLVTASKLTRALLEREALVALRVSVARPALLVTLELVEMLELVVMLKPALLEMLELADLLMPVWEDRPELTLQAMLDLELALLETLELADLPMLVWEDRPQATRLETPVWEALQVLAARPALLEMLELELELMLLGTLRGMPLPLATPTTRGSYLVPISSSETTDVDYLS